MKHKYIESLLSEIQQLELKVINLKENQKVPFSFFKESFKQTQKIAHLLHELEFVQIEDMKGQMEKLVHFLSDSENTKDEVKTSLVVETTKKPNEKVDLGWKRIWEGKQYEVIQPHMTVIGQTPDLTPALWKLVPSEEIPVWKQPTGAHDAYRLGAKVHYPTINDPIYESLIDYNVYSPLTYPAGWKKL